MKIFNLKKNIQDFDSDTQLMLRFRDGDDNAFSEIFNKYYQKVAQLCWRYTLNKDTAEDAAQEIFMKIYQNISNYKPTASFSTYIYRISANHCLNIIRDQKRHLSYSLDENWNSDDDNQNKPLNYIPSNIQNPRENVMQKELDEKLLKAISELPKKQKMALILKKFDNLSYEEISKSMNCSTGAVDSLLQRARITLTDKLKKILGEGFF